MPNVDDKNRISDEIEQMFEDLSVDQIAHILTVQIATLTAQASDNREEALQFLNEIRDDAAEYLAGVDFDQLDGEGSTDGDIPDEVLKN